MTLQETRAFNDDLAELLAKYHVKALVGLYFSESGTTCQLNFYQPTDLVMKTVVAHMQEMITGYLREISPNAKFNAHQDYHPGKPRKN